MQHQQKQALYIFSPGLQSDGSQTPRWTDGVSQTWALIPDNYRAFAASSYQSPEETAEQTDTVLNKNATFVSYKCQNMYRAPHQTLLIQ